MTFTNPHCMAFKAHSHDLNTKSAKEVKEFMQIQWSENKKTSGKLACLHKSQQVNHQRQDRHELTKHTMCPINTW